MQQVEARRGPTSHTSHKIDLLLVVTTDVEHRAVVEAAVAVAGSKPPSVIHGRRRTYDDLGVIGGARVAVVQTHMGTSTVGGSLPTIQAAISELQPNIIIMVGIAFGVDSGKQPIGTVLVAEKVHQYEIERIGTSATGELQRIKRGDKATASVDVLSRLRTANRRRSAKFGLLLSGEKLVDNLDYREELRSFEPEAIGGEMEGGGLYVAATEERLGWCIVKAVCDWADGKKREDKEHRQQLAAAAAAEYVMTTIVAGGFAAPESRVKAKRRMALIVSALAVVALASAVAWNWASVSSPRRFRLKTSDLLTRPVAPMEVITTGVNLSPGARFVANSVFAAGEAACFKLVGEPTTRTGPDGYTWIEVRALNECGRTLRFTATFRYEEPEP